MKEQYYFKQTGNPEISVAIAGISRWDWKAIAHGQSLESAVAIMKSNSFDILPIIGPSGCFDEYYTTQVWGDYRIENITQETIKDSDHLYYLTNIHDAIIKFAKTGKRFFFLDNQVDIVGLITIGNLNCKNVYLYLYNLIIQLEHALGRFIYQQGLKDSQLIEMFQQRGESINALSSLQRYNEDNAKGLDYNFIEYVFLTDLCYIIKKTGGIEKLDISARQFESLIGKINEIRKVVAHPNKSLVRNDSSIIALHEAILAIDLIMDRLNVTSKDNQKADTLYESL